MFHVVLVEPEIPPNTGNIIRLCANTGAHLHLIRPLGFPLDDAKMRRAGLDYSEFANMHVYDNWAHFIRSMQPDASRLFALTTRGQVGVAQIDFQAGDFLIFGSETKGLNPEVRDTLADSQKIRLPMMPENRSLNLSNAVAIVVYEAWRQIDYAGSI